MNVLGLNRVGRVDKKISLNDLCSCRADRADILRLRFASRSHIMTIRDFKDFLIII